MKEREVGRLDGANAKTLRGTAEASNVDRPTSRRWVGRRNRCPHCRTPLVQKRRAAWCRECRYLWMGVVVG